MIVIDASVWVSRALPSDVHHSQSRVWATRFSTTRERLVVPSIFLVEFGSAVCRRTDSAHQARKAVLKIASDPVFNIIDLDLQLISDSTDVAMDLRVRGADAIYVALAQRLNLALVTWDHEQLERAGPILNVMTPVQALERMT
jgi:predicted nucleic acid-binding protein